MTKVAIEVVRESLHFSAAHFTIFSATEREKLHGHNFRLQGVFESEIKGNGLCFDYDKIKRSLQALCDSLDERFLVPAHSPYLKVESKPCITKLQFNTETFQLPTQDVLVMPLRNITVEELANWFADQLQSDVSFASLGVNTMQIKVASGSGQWGVVTRDLA